MEALAEYDDATMLTLAQDVDRCCAGIRADVLGTVARVRAEFQRRAAAAVDARRAEWAAERDGLGRQIAAVQNIAERTDAALQRTLRVRARMADLLGARAQRRRMGDTVRCIVARWATLAHRGAYRRRAVAAMQRRSIERHRRSVWMRWCVGAMKRGRAKVTAALESKLQRVTASLTGAKQEVQNRLTLENMALAEKLRKEEEMRAVLEEKLKGAFLRGVCALNAEAMQVIRGGSGFSATDTVTVASLMQGLQSSATLSYDEELLARQHGASDIVVTPVVTPLVIEAPAAPPAPPFTPNSTARKPTERMNVNPAVTVTLRQSNAASSKGRHAKLR